MDWRARRERFRALIGAQPDSTAPTTAPTAAPTAATCVHPASVFDPISARIAEDLGFELGMFAGSTASLTVLGAPDLILLTLSEFAQQALRINRACNLPLAVDADHGYGNALNVRRTVQELETAGVSAMSIEDTELPAVFGHARSQRLLPLHEGVGKIRAAIEAREDPSLVICGRTSAAAITSLDDAIARGKAYQAAGADMLFFVGLKTRAQLDAIASAVQRPIFLGGTSAPELLDRDYLASRGVRISLQGHQAITAGYRAVYDTLRALREGVPPSQLHGLPDAAFMRRVTRDADYERWLDDYLGGAENNA